MRVIVAGAAVDSGEVARAIPHAVTVSCADYSHAFAELQRGAGLVVTVASFGPACSMSGITLAGQARARGVPCVIVDRHAEDGMMGAAGMMPGGDLADAVRRANALRPVK